MNAARVWLHRRWNEYDTRTVVHHPGSHLTAEQLKAGYNWAYQEFYFWANITWASLAHDSVKHQIRHFAYAGGWKRFEPLWNFMIKTRQLNSMWPWLEVILAKVQGKRPVDTPTPADVIPLPINFIAHQGRRIVQLISAFRATATRTTASKLKACLCGLRHIGSLSDN
ncbi:hypothetical protein [Hymenobacter volaticus]|uniref:Uncharacterized protein n=1 Tax=Hymenobacter volaticus TaxID=2932254 RepID=A0ABY4G7K1_9BACT|nr:hypothetical protein [Hymenobacter volaticus]UOQ66740.1 hypothetical protein MUN86_02080 [Hymenobacter volaticus]